MRNLILALLLLCSPAAFAQGPDLSVTSSPVSSTMSDGGVRDALTSSISAPMKAPPAKGAQVDGLSDDAVGALIVLMVEAAKAGHWSVFGGFLVLLMVWGFNRLGLKDKIGPKYVPWVSLGVGALLSVALGLSQGAPIIDSLKLGLLEGGLAIALWELAAKHFFKKEA